MVGITGDVLALDIDKVPAIEVGPGCLRRDLPSRASVRSWIVDMAPGAEWPFVDEHDEFGEDVYVISGEMIEGDKVYGPGTFLHFGANSSHKPRTETGLRLFGFNLKA
jgi:hypothetical protein